MGLILEPPETARTSQHSIVLRDLEEVLNWAPIVLRNASFSDSPCKISQPALVHHLSKKNSPKSSPRNIVFKSSQILIN